MPRADDGSDPGAGWVGESTRKQRPKAAPDAANEGLTGPLLAGRSSIVREPELTKGSPQDEIVCAETLAPLTMYSPAPAAAASAFARVHTATARATRTDTLRPCGI